LDIGVTSKKIVHELREARNRVIGMNAGAESDRARKPRCRRGREPSEETAGQAAVIVDHDPSGELVGGVGLIWNHFKFLAQRLPSRQSIMAGGFA
jgi:hypothetical protein